MNTARRSLLVLLACRATLQSQVPRDFVVDLAVAVSDASPRIVLSWTLRQPRHISRQMMYRRLKGANSWGPPLAALSNSATSYWDLTAEAGIEYEYWLQRMYVGLNPSTAMGYISAGVKVPQTDSRGTLLLLVDDTMVAPLAPEIAQLRDDLTADGWAVQQITALRSGTAASTKALIAAAYNDSPSDVADPVARKAVKMVYILGHVPVPYSGFALDPDGHGNRALPADGYYGDMDGTWTDAATYGHAITSKRGENVANDGKFDQDYFPSLLELQIGRVDLSNLQKAPSSGVSEASLLRRYLRKAHDFRYKQGPYADIPRSSLIRDGFGYFSGECFAMNGWASAFTCSGNSSTAPAIDEAPTNRWFDYAAANSYLLGHINGSGSSTGFSGGGDSFEFGRKASKVVFVGAFGSFSGDWDVADAAMRSILAGNATGDSLGLTCYWAGRPNGFMHHMGMGETIGYAIRTTQNSKSSYVPAGDFSSGVHTALMGDPSLRLYMVEPPRHLVATSSNSRVVLSWSASTEAGLQGYHVYRSETRSGPFIRLTGAAPLNATTFTDATGVAGQSYTFMVRTLKLETVTGGSYTNLSQGVLATLPVSSSATAAPLNPTALSVAQTGTGVLTWTGNSDGGVGFRIERRTSVEERYSALATVGKNATTFTDPGPFAYGITYYYRVIAIGAGGESMASNEDSFDASAGSVDFQTVSLRKVNRSAAIAQIPVERFGGVAGAIKVSYVTADSSAESGTHFNGGSGELGWGDGEGGIKNISIPMESGNIPHQARQFRITLSNPTGGAALGVYHTVAVLIEDPAASLPCPWNQAIIDNVDGATVRVSSPAVLAEGALGSTIVGGLGLDGSRTWESGQFISQPWTGDGVLTAYVAAPIPEQPGSRFAVMVRAHSKRDSKMAATVTTGNPTLGSKFLYRLADSKAYTILGPANKETSPCWIRIIRKGDTFTSQSSVDGAKWKTLGSAPVSLPATSSWGLYHISENPDIRRQLYGDYQLATFQNVSLVKLPEGTLADGSALPASTDAR